MSRSLSILVLDDDTESADSLAELFALEEHRVIVAYDGESAVDAFRRHAIDVGFFDVMMPGKNGVESFIEIKQRHPEARVYFMTGYSADDLLNRARAAGCLGIFNKPVDLPQMLDTLEHIA